MRRAPASHGGQYSPIPPPGGTEIIRNLKILSGISFIKQRERQVMQFTVTPPAPDSCFQQPLFTPKNKAAPDRPQASNNNRNNGIPSFLK